MPIYEYQCQNCGYLFEELQTMSEAPLVICPNCNKDTLKKLIGSGGGIIFKGSGFYQTDYKKPAPEAKENKTESKEKSQEKTEAKTDLKSESKTESKTDSQKAKTETKSKTEAKPETKVEAKKDSKPSPKKK